MITCLSRPMLILLPFLLATSLLLSCDRENKAAASNPQKKTVSDAEAIEGPWDLVSININNQFLPDKDGFGKQSKITFTGQFFHWHVSGKFALFPKEKPPQMELTFGEGTDQKSIRATYELAEDQIKLAYTQIKGGDFGPPPPDCNPGPGIGVFTFKRAK